MVFSRSRDRRYRPYQLALFGCLLLLLSGCSLLNSASTPTATPTASPVTIIDTWDNIHTFLTFDGKVSDPSGISNRYDFIWGAEVNHVPALIAGNPNIFLTYYMPFHRDLGTFADDGGVYRLSYWQSTHPDWILYKCDRTTPAYEYGDLSVPFDFTNPAVIAWQVQTYAIPAMQSGYKGIAADNLNLVNLFGACGFYKNGKWVQRYSGQLHDPQWSADVITWLERMRQALHGLPHPMALIPNLSVSSLGPLVPNNQLVQQVVSNVDGIVDEGGFTNYAQGYLSAQGWQARVQFIEYVQEQHKPYYIIDLFPTVGNTELQWSLASYLMAKGHECALYIGTPQTYGQDAWHKEYYALIGSPSDSMYQWQNVFVRDYSKGLTVVNPDPTKTYTFTPNPFHTYSDIYGNPIGKTITLPPHSGMVMLRTN